MRATSQSDLNLSRNASDGDAAAWDELIHRYGGRIFGIARQFARDPAEAEDLTQEIFLKLYRNLHRYRGDVPLVAWSLKLSRNLCIEHYRRTRHERRSGVASEDLLEQMPGTDDPRETVERRQRLATVQRAMAQMSRDLALVVALRDLQGLSYEETAATLEIPMGTLKSRLVRARRELAERVADLVQPVPPEGDGAWKEASSW
ncbi:MAG: sigma-70 family RNA polymerase sigma factor [Acidobacteria bacterium]|nr:sigma-70 family RNA polymerase sigma factor [Acidobacteriota bacterium]